MSFCGKCGTKIADGAKFCPSCGTPVAQQTPPPTGGQQYNNQGNGNPQFVNQFFNTADHTGAFSQSEINEGKGVSVLAYFGPLFFIPLVAKPNSGYAKFHANQGLMLFLTGAALGIIYAIVSAIIHAIFKVDLGWGISYGLNTIGSLLLWLFRIVCNLPTLILFILGLVNAANGRAKELPFIGKFTLIR